MQELSIGTWFLIIATLSMTSITTAGIYEAIYVMPQWFANVPKSLAIMQNKSRMWFWLPLQIIAALSITGSAITNWNDSIIHTPLLLAIICYILVWVVTLIFFIPGVIRFIKADVTKPHDPQLTAYAHSWLKRSWARQAAMVVCTLALFIALALT